MNDLLKEAIADAKAVRETAMANAKAALEEAFTPRLQSMLHAKLAEEMEEEMPMEEEEYTAGVDDLGPALEEEEMELDLGEPEMGEPEMELDLDEILRELEGEDEMPVEEPAMEEEEFDLDEIIAALREEEGEDEMMAKAAEEEMEEGKYEKEMEEAYNVIRYLKSQLQEVNLLNAKLLFSNKLFKNYELNESQKMKVIENFDRAHNMREVKLVYSTLAEGFGKTKSKVRIKESYASKPTRSTKPSTAVITESNHLAERWKKLAGLSK
jgi:hypothetical protein